MKVERPWDGESYCLADGCRQPATVEVLDGMAGDDVVVGLYCHDCAAREEAPPPAGAGGGAS